MLRKARVKLVDCNHEDPTCREYYDLLIPPTQTDKIGKEVIHQFSNGTNNFDELSIKVFDIYGRPIFDGIQSEFDPLKLTLQKGIYILVKFDEFGRITSSDEILIMH